ncbi:hypothetical protein [Paenibacillus abyssi]|uniref:Uncharacterized protein n=1 Tax=Paenibacillus abyssi TaxID=1340531 RepID=A0A917G5Y4_9BACL|nr:hypothetical protein [Paenibacillus abyssi]GGG24312.1 hypothetical protein GCM10010916_46040 [Paenibacillus abyssi]
MPEMVTLGPLTLDGLLLSVLISAAAGLLALTAWMRTKHQLREGPWVDLLFNVIVITGVCWKLGFLIGDPSLLWERPLSLLMVRGSELDALIGLTLSVIYLAFALRKRKLPLQAFLGVLPFALLPSLFIWNLLSAFPYQVPYALLNAILYLYLVRSSNEEGSAAVLRLYLLGMGFGGLVVSLFAVYPPGELIRTTLGLTGMQWIFIAHGIIGVFTTTKHTQSEPMKQAEQADEAQEA